MIIGVPREVFPGERRVALAPAVLRGAAFFESVNYDVLHAPTTNISRAVAKLARVIAVDFSQ
jgi:hypothetical protein